MSDQQQCDNCRFFKKQSNQFYFNHQNKLPAQQVHQFDGLCRHFPSYEPKDRDEWCGQWKGKNEPVCIHEHGPHLKP